MAGAIGPMPVTASISGDVNDPAFRSVNFEQLRKAYEEQVRSLHERRIVLQEQLARPACAEDF